MNTQWQNLGTSTHYQSRKDNLFHTKVDAYISRQGDTASVHKADGWFGTTSDTVYFAPAPTDDVILSNLAKPNR